MLLLFIYIFVASMFVDVLQKVIPLFVFVIKARIDIYVFQLIDWLLTYLVLYNVSFHSIYCSQYVCGCFTRRNLSVVLWPYHYLLSSSLTDWFSTYLGLYVVSFHLHFVASMFMSVLDEAISLNFCEIIKILYPVHWLIGFFTSLGLYVVSFHLIYCS